MDTMHTSKTLHIGQKELTYASHRYSNVSTLVPSLQCDQKPPTRFFPVAPPFFPAGGRPPKRPGKTCVLAIVGYESL
jgi:hypothetical protein